MIRSPRLSREELYQLRLLVLDGTVGPHPEWSKAQILERCDLMYGEVELLRRFIIERLIPRDLERIDMGLRNVEAAILQEARTVTGLPKLKQRDILEWTTGTIEPRKDEQVFQLPEMGVSIAISRELTTAKKVPKKS